jgi:peroxiredoxin
MKISTLLLFLLLASGLQSQELTLPEILAKSDARLRSLKAWSYWIDHEMKYLAYDDTTHLSAICYLQPVPEDSMRAYHHLIDLPNLKQQVYDGESVLNVNLKDSTSIVFNTKLYGYSSIKGSMFSELYRRDLLRDSFFTRRLAHSELLEADWREADYHGVPCYTVRFQYADDEEVSNMSVVYHLRREDFFPIGMQESLDFQNMRQYRAYLLSNLAFAERFDERLFDIEAHVPDPSKVTQYAPREQPLLEVGQPAPAIEKETVGGERFALQDYRGRFVVLDFWYRSCYPCLKAMPELQRIAEAFDPAEVAVVGVNVFDKPEKIVPMLEEKGLSHTNIHGAKDIAQAYQVSGYPTLYIIDREGRIAYSHVGWSSGFYAAIAAQLEQMLR